MAFMRIRRRHHQDPNIVHIHSSVKSILYKLEDAKKRQVISPEEFRQQIEKYCEIFDEIFLDISLHRKKFAFYSPMLLKLQANFLSELDKELQL